MKLPGFLSKEKWALVKTIKHQTAHYNYHIHLFESNKNNRKAVFLRDGKEFDIEKDYNNLKETDLYQQTIYFWLSGRRHLDIPRYSEIDEDDTANALRGKI